MLSVTIFDFDLADFDRGVYETIALRVAVSRQSRTNASSRARAYTMELEAPAESS
jgi:hypothetical protein